MISGSGWPIRLAKLEPPVGHFVSIVKTILCGLLLENNVRGGALVFISSSLQTHIQANTHKHTYMNDTHTHIHHTHTHTHTHTNTYSHE